MPSIRFASLTHYCATLFLAGLLTCAQAAELGDAALRSHIGQPLVADIELTSLADPAVPVTVRLAHADVYRGAGIRMHPVLSSLNMSVMRRDGRQFLHITSIKPVETEYVHLFLELAEGSRRNIRSVTLWLTPDPAPPPPPKPAPVAVPAPLPPPKPVRELTLRGPTPPAQCQQRFSEEQVKACAAIDYKNGLLSAQIVELEEKVKQLQLALDAKVAQTAVPPPPPAKKTPAIPPPPPKKAKEAESGFPWLLAVGIAAALLALGGGAWFALSRRKGQTAQAAAAGSVAWYSRLTGRFRRKPNGPAEPDSEASGEA